MTIDEAKTFVSENLDEVYWHRNYNHGPEKVMVRVVGWSWAYKSVFIIVSIDPRVKISTPPWTYQSREKGKDIFLTKRKLEGGLYWYVSNLENLLEKVVF